MLSLNRQKNNYIQNPTLFEERGVEFVVVKEISPLGLPHPFICSTIPGNTIPYKEIDF